MSPKTKAENFKSFCCKEGNFGFPGALLVEFTLLAGAQEFQ
jgi:hypothetical protein